MAISSRRILRWAQPQSETVSNMIVGGYGAWAGDYAAAEATMQRVSTAMGREVMHGHCFFDHNWGWTAIEGDQTLLSAWGAWIAAKPGRSVSISVPLLPYSTDGGTTLEPARGDFAGLANGVYDSHFATLGQNLAASAEWNTAILRLGWEFNGYSWPWSPTQDRTSGSLAQAVADWKVGFTRAVQAIRSTCPGVKIMWCPSLGYDALPGYSLENLYPDDGAVDYVGFGAYDYNLNVTDYSNDVAGRLQRWEDNWSKPNGYANMVALASAHGKDLAHVEWGLWPLSYQSQQGGGDDSVFIEKTAEYCRQYNVRLSVYNNSIPEHMLETYHDAQLAYQEIFNRYFA
ncbi:hypothetical protein CR983_01800 [Candidatus Saccharibacteria bacterium]|nr:MAG: hypothetical protein CR983_01800 [Candidatus Saccharibacteria bacterium]